jgi:hypothetical protein
MLFYLFSYLNVYLLIHLLNYLFFYLFFTYCDSIIASRNPRADAWELS